MTQSQSIDLLCYVVYCTLLFNQYNKSIKKIYDV